jgi:hypothetical protein
MPLVRWCTPVCWYLKQTEHEWRCWGFLREMLRAHVICGVDGALSEGGRSTDGETFYDFRNESLREWGKLN